MKYEHHTGDEDSSFPEEDVRQWLSQQVPLLDGGVMIGQYQFRATETGEFSSTWQTTVQVTV